jgi:hypothetical protein
VLKRWGNVLLGNTLRVGKSEENFLVNLYAELLSALAGARWARPLPAVDWIVYG